VSERGQAVNTKIFVVQIEIVPIFAFWLDGADVFRVAKKLLSFAQESRKGWDVVAWKQIAEIEYKTIDPKEGKAEAEGVDERHLLERKVVKNGYIL
jgi:hypothetical protein